MGLYYYNIAYILALSIGYIYMDHNNMRIGFYLYRLRRLEEAIHIFRINKYHI